MMADVAAAVDGDLDRLRSHPYDPSDGFWRTAGEQRVDLLLLDLARTSGADQAWTAGPRALARAVAVDAAAMRSLRDRELRRVLDLLGAARIPCLIIKGAALAYTLYRHPHLRPRSDADLLIRSGDIDRVAALLEIHGYARAAEIGGGYATSQMHFDRPEQEDPRHALDIHWRLVNPHAFLDAVAFDELAAARIRVPELGGHAWTLCTAHALTLACIHSVAHHPNSEDLLWEWDVHLLVSAMGDADPGVFVDMASRSAARAVCARTLTAASARFRTPDAATLIDLVRPRSDSPREASASFLSGGLSQAAILRSDLATLGWRRGATLVREHLFPPAMYMRSRYHHWPPVLLPAAYIHRIVCGAPKWLRLP